MKAGLYLGCALGQPTTVGDVCTALACGIAIGWFLALFV